MVRRLAPTLRAPAAAVAAVVAVLTVVGRDVTGFFVGGVFGAMAGILLAPKSGDELRRGFAEGGEKLRETTSHTVSELRGSSDDAREAYDRAREALSEAVEGLKEATKVMTGRKR